MKNKSQIRYGIDRNGRRTVKYRAFLNGVGDSSTGTIHSSMEVYLSGRKSGYTSVEMNLDVADCSRKCSLEFFIDDVHDEKSVERVLDKLGKIKEALRLMEEYIKYAKSIPQSEKGDFDDEI